MPIRAMLTILCNNPTRRIATLAAFVLSYLLLIAYLRFQRLPSLHRKYSQYSTRQGMAQMTDYDA
jgi:hypothetical protein